MLSGLIKPLHLIVILVIVIIIFGAGKLPEIGEGLAKSIKSFKRGMADTEPDQTTTKSSEGKEEKKT